MTAKKKKRVVIVGFAPDSREMAANWYDDEEAEIWGLNELYMEMPKMAERADAWFQVHGFEPHTVRDPDHPERLQLMASNNTKVYMWRKHRVVKDATVYPREEILEYFDPYGEGMCPERVERRERQYFTNSISWMIALAIYKKFEEIIIVGTNMAQDQEYSHQRPSCEFFLGWARGAGIKIYLPIQSDLLMAWGMYGWDEGTAFYQKMLKRQEELTQRVNGVANQRMQHQNEAQNLLNQEHQLRGALEDTAYHMNLGTGLVGVTVNAVPSNEEGVQPNEQKEISSGGSSNG